MTVFNSKTNLILFLIAISVFNISVPGQPDRTATYKSQEISEKDGLPVLIKHLPAWEDVRPQTTFAKSVDELRAILGDRPILELIDFTGGTEAVSAPYEAGKLVIIEYTTPQASVDADSKFTAQISDSGDRATIYRRIGNYNVLVFDVTDPGAANELIDQVKYEKTVQWLGTDPFKISPERAFVIGTSDLFISTVLIVVFGISFALVGGLIIGYIFFIVRDRKRASMPTFTDAGGMTRLNLDGFTPEIVPKGFLKD